MMLDEWAYDIIDGGCLPTIPEAWCALGYYTLSPHTTFDWHPHFIAPPALVS